jgi:hypothetical protein
MEFLTVFYLNLTMLLIMLRSPLSLHGIRSENNLHQIGTFTQVSDFGYAGLETSRKQKWQKVTCLIS